MRLAHAIVCLALGACYGPSSYMIAQPLTQAERDAFTCEDLALEVGKLEEYLVYLRGIGPDGLPLPPRPGFSQGDPVDRMIAKQYAQARLAELRACAEAKGCTNIPAPIPPVERKKVPHSGR